MCWWLLQCIFQAVPSFFRGKKSRRVIETTILEISDSGRSLHRSCEVAEGKTTVCATKVYPCVIIHCPPRNCRPGLRRHSDNSIGEIPATVPTIENPGSPKVRTHVFVQPSPGGRSSLRHAQNGILSNYRPWLSALWSALCILRKIVVGCCRSKRLRLFPVL